MHNRFVLLLILALCTVTPESQNIFFVNPENMHLIQRAFATYSGGAIAPSYYSMTVNGQRMRGERPWEIRWNLIKDAMNYDEKRILDLGCNIGLLNACMQKYRKPASYQNIDAPHAFLARQGQTQKLQAAQWIAQAFEVPFHLKQFDFDKDDYENKIGYDYDVVFCLSLLHWLKDAGRMMRYLSNFNHVFFEGTGTAEGEITRFEHYGFKAHVLGVADKGRTVIHFYK